MDKKYVQVGRSGGSACAAKWTEKGPDQRGPKRAQICHNRTQIDGNMSRVGPVMGS